jgi:hypothetical protein
MADDEDNNLHYLKNFLCTDCIRMQIRAHAIVKFCCEKNYRITWKSYRARYYIIK